jgi:hypothetical protein
MQQQLTTLALAKSVRKPMPPRGRIFKDTRRKQRNHWKKEIE